MTHRPLAAETGARQPLPPRPPVLTAMRGQSLEGLHQADGAAALNTSPAGTHTYEPNNHVHAGETEVGRAPPRAPGWPLW